MCKFKLVTFLLIAVMEYISAFNDGEFHKSIKHIYIYMRRQTQLKLYAIVATNMT